MNWLGDLIQKTIDENNTVLDLGCGIMQATLDHVKTYPKTKLKCKELTGVDIYKPYLDFLNKNYPEIKTVLWDLRITPLPFKDKSYDVILLTDILEHLSTIEDVKRLLKEADRIARKFVFVLTPNVFFRNIDAINYHNMGNNEYEVHNLLITKELLRNYGYKKLRTKGIHIWGFKKLNMKILHVFDVAGVAGCMSKYQKRLGNDVKVIINKEWDSYRFRDVYEYDCLLHSPRILRFKLFGIIRIIIKYLMISIIIKTFNPDIIHFHVYEFYPLLFPFRKKIIEFHGTRLRNKLADGSINKIKKTPKWIFKLYRLFRINYYVSTIDLLNDVPNGKIIHNPVDIELFSKSKYKNPYNKKALYTLNHYEKPFKALNISFMFGLELTILDRKRGDIIYHKDFPEYLSKFHVFIDRYNIHSLSKTALECLAMGIPVIDWRGMVLYAFPYVNEPEYVANRTLEIYMKEINK